jgi:hypothetical protein
MTYNLLMYTVAETNIFRADCESIWSDAERLEFISWIAANPDAGSVVSGSGGCRKVRWARAGMGKRGGARVIYFNRLDAGIIWLLVIYAKAVRGNIPAALLRRIKQEIDND